MKNFSKTQLKIIKSNYQEMLRRTAGTSWRHITSSWAIGSSNWSVTQCPSFDASGITCISVWQKPLAVRRGLSTATDNAKPQAPSKRDIYFPTEEELENEKEKSAKLSGGTYFPIAGTKGSFIVYQLNPRARHFDGITKCPLVHCK